GAGAADCCSALCGANHTCEANPSNCATAGAPCMNNVDCCSTSCINGTCANVQCTADGRGCSSNGACCSGNCANGTCAKLNPNCATVGNPCMRTARVSRPSAADGCAPSPLTAC